MSGRLGFEIAVNHALQIAVLAGIAFCITRMWAKNRPYLAHAIWALVLLKCLLPPVIPSPLSPFSWIASFGLTNVAEENVGPVDNAAAQTKVTIVREPRSPALLGHSDNTEKLVLELSEKDKISLFGYLVLGWLASTLLILIGFIIRFMLFTSMVHNKSVEVPSSILQQLAELSRQLGIKRKVRVRVLDSQIGPAVMGVWRPTLLLPRIIVDAAEPAQLRLLLAHELIHVRRGDLVWSALQVVAASLWWFHPAVWLTNRFLTRESERSCDEQTIASLGCRPADYARSLVAVLEARQQLTAAPIVPGLRPVDITLKRLERIMQIGHGSRAYTPHWVFAMLVVGAIIVLPGSAWLQAQEKADEPRAANPAPTKNVESATAVTTGRAKGDKAATATQLMASIIVMEVPVDLVKTIQPNVPHDTELTQGVWSGEVTSDRGLTGRILLPAHVERSGKFTYGLPVANKNSAGPVSDEQPKAASSEGGSLNWILDSNSLEKVEAWLESPADSEIKVISRPKMVFESGSLARMTIGNEHPFVTSVDAESEQPTVVSKFLGVSCDIMATEQLSDKSDNAPRSATVQFELKHSELLKVDNTTVKSKRGNNATVQLPTIVTRCCKLDLNLPLGATVGATVGVQSSDDRERTTMFLIRVDRVED